MEEFQLVSEALLSVNTNPAHGKAQDKQAGIQFEGTSRSPLYEMCAADRKGIPLIECCKDEGPNHSKLQPTQENALPSSGYRSEAQVADFDETARGTNALGAFLLEELQIEETGHVSSFVTIPASQHTIHGKETKEKYTLLHLTAMVTVGSTHKGTARSRLYEMCAANHWNAPSFTYWDDDGPSNSKLFTCKVTLEVGMATPTILESFSKPSAKKKGAAEHAAEGAVWCLQCLGYLPMA